MHVDDDVKIRRLLRIEFRWRHPHRVLDRQAWNGKVEEIVPRCDEQHGERFRRRDDDLGRIVRRQHIALLLFLFDPDDSSRRQLERIELHAAV